VGQVPPERHGGSLCLCFPFGSLVILSHDLQGLERWLPSLAAAMREKVGPTEVFLIVVDSSFTAHDYARVAA